MADLYKRIELVVTISLIAGFAFMATQGLKKQAPTIRDQIRSILSGPDFKTLENLYNVYKIAEFGEESIPELKELLNSDVILERWAAIVSLTSLLKENPTLEENIMPSLRQALEDENDTIKMFTAYQLLSLGKKDGFPVLISLLESEETAFLSDPPEQIKDRSFLFLQGFTEYNGQTQQEWQEWWKKNKDYLFWDKERSIFKITENHEN